MGLNFNPLQSQIASDNVTGLAGLSTLVDGDKVSLLGYYTAGDGGGQELVYHTTGRPTEDGGFYFDGPGADDYFEALDKSVATAKQFGAVTGASDSSLNIQAMLDSGASSLVIDGDFTSGTDSPTLLISQSDFRLDCYGTITFADDVLVTGSSGKFRMVDCNNFHVVGLAIDGNRLGRGLNGDVGAHLLSVIGGSRGVFVNCDTSNGPVDGVYIAGSDFDDHLTFPTEIRFENHRSSNNTRQGMSVINARSLYVNGVFSDTNGLSPGAGIDIEPNSSPADGSFAIEDVILHCCRFENNVKGLAVAGATSRNVQIISPSFINNGHVQAIIAVACKMSDVMSTGFLTEDWAATTAFSVDDKVVTSTFLIYVCVTEGTTSSTEPTGTTATESDGSVVWEYRGPSGSLRSQFDVTSGQIPVVGFSIIGGSLTENPSSKPCFSVHSAAVNCSISGLSINNCSYLGYSNGRDTLFSDNHVSDMQTTTQRMWQHADGVFSNNQIEGSPLQAILAGVVATDIVTITGNQFTNGSETFAAVWVLNARAILTGNTFHSASANTSGTLQAGGLECNATGNIYINQNQVVASGTVTGYDAP